MSKTRKSSLLTFTSLLLFALSAAGCAGEVAVSTPTWTPLPTPTSIPSETPTTAPTVPPTPTPTRSFTPAQPSANSSTYIVKPGDTLYQIAARYGVTLGALQQLNNLPDPNSIAVGQAITVPTSSTPVKPGIVADSLTARQGGTLMIRIAKPNLASVTGMIKNKTIPFTRGDGYFYAFVGVSLCEKLGSLSFKLTETDTSVKSTTEDMAINVVGTNYPVETYAIPPKMQDILNDRKLLNDEAIQLANLVNKFTLNRLWNGLFRVPMDSYITQNFGTLNQVDRCGHTGTDFRGKVGDPIYSDARGQVVFAGLTQVRGNLVVVDHGLGIFSAYFHQSAIAVKVGQMVEPGNLIGKVGGTGLATGPHLHWSMWVNGEYVDPMEWTKRVFP